MSGRCRTQTDTMVDFLTREFNFRNIEKNFVKGVRGFELVQPCKLNPTEVKVYKTVPKFLPGDIVYIQNHGNGTIIKQVSADRFSVKLDSGRTEPAIASFGITLVERSAASQKTEINEKTEGFQMSIAEILEWQKTFRVFASSSVFTKDTNRAGACARIQKLLSGQSERGAEAFRAKFMVRISQSPVLCLFDGIPRTRALSNKSDTNIYLISQPGVDFAGRTHDEDDVKVYIKNWRKIFKLKDNGELQVFWGRDFDLVKNPPKCKLDSERLFQDLCSMAHLRLYAASVIGVKIVVETGIGLGVFAGDHLGIGDVVRMLSAEALKHVLEKYTFDNIEAVCLALPVFRQGDNYFHFVKYFKGYTGKIPVVILDNDMHRIAVEAAKAGFRTSELSPADSHCVFGEYWQNYGPGTEEKLALTTAGILTQHHAVNPRVLSQESYYVVDLDTVGSGSNE